MHTRQRSTRPRLRHIEKSAFISRIFRVFYAVSSLPMRLLSLKTPEFGGISNGRIHAGAAFNNRKTTPTSEA
ncbi:hypothetical protein Y032_0949g3175 [Ancylostoma ceylanicum]|uniref:Uncharacterized protein n=1 Tax=Ancylostoma ceylanicum TaxID=53326 RepID=A0A016W9P3_9BILA|nr:hypothetical protein Y032_0949g3175 [Ancylostoma ceylanicum]